MIRAYVILGSLLLYACTKQDTDVYLTRPGNGNTGSHEETLRYYAALSSGARLGAESTLTEWLNNRCFNTPGNGKIETDYYNAADLGLGRELLCWECPAGDPNAGLISCSVSNHGVPQGLDRFQFTFGDGVVKEDVRQRQASSKFALKLLDNYLTARNNGSALPLRGASVVFDFREDREDAVRLYIYDANDQKLFSAVNPNRDDPVAGREHLITGLQLDGEGGALNARVKFMRNCLTCHGGKYDEKTDRILGLSFLDIDAALMNFGNDEDPDIALNQRDANQLTACQTNLPRMKLMMEKYVKRVVTKTGAIMIQDRIDHNLNNNFFLSANSTGPCLKDKNKFYVPDGWNKGRIVARFPGRDISDREFFNVAVHKYCASCHFSQVPIYNLHGRNGVPLTFATAEQWFQNENLIDLDTIRRENPNASSVDLIRKVVCGSSDMPHAEVTRLNMLRDSQAFSYVCSAEPVPF